MKVLTVVGARPNFMKAAPVIAAIERRNKLNPAAARIEHLLLHTGQHYDARMSDSFFNDLGMPNPDIQLGVGSGSHAVQTAEIIAKFETVLLKERPDAVIVVGDVNSTVACALVTSKISFDAKSTRPLLAHVESGLRSFDRNMPEEVNRVLTDHMADLLFVTEESGLRNLANEGIAASKIHFVGNTMIDSLLAFEPRADASTILDTIGLRGRQYALLTMHRASNVDDRETFLQILDGLKELTDKLPVVFPVHPRTRQRIADFGLQFATNGAGADASVGNGIILTDPLGYIDFVHTMKNAAIVVTDSGGIQEETTCLGVPCVTIRENTERPVTIEMGTNVLAGTSTEGICDAIHAQLARPAGKVMPPHWDGQAAGRIVEVLVAAHQAKVNLLESLQDSAARELAHS